MNYNKFFEHALTSIKDEGRYRIFADLERIAGDFPKAWHYYEGNKHKITVWCSNDYLSMGQHPRVLSAMHHAIDQCGAGAGGTRNIGGTNHYHILLENCLATLHKKENALLFTSGYAANEAALYALGRYLPNAIFFSDECNHASMIHGIVASKSEKIVFKHNDVADLEEKLKQADPTRAKIIAFESLYSMDGDFSPLKEFIALAKKYNALTYVDEVHAVGVYGAQGGGVIEEQHLEQDVDIICANFGKAVGVMGGYITGSHALVDFIRSFAPPFIFTTALPPAVAAAALASIRHFSQYPSERLRLKEVAKKVKTRLMQAGFPILDKGSHIVPLVIGDPHLCKQITDRLLFEHRIYVQPINYPTVPKGTERLRITPCPCHSDQMIDEFITALTEVWAHFSLFYQKKTAIG